MKKTFRQAQDLQRVILPFFTIIYLFLECKLAKKDGYFFISITTIFHFSPPKSKVIKPPFSPRGFPLHGKERGLTYRETVARSPLKGAVTSTDRAVDQ